MSENTQVVAGSEVETQVAPAVEVNGESTPVVTPKKVANVKKNTKKVAPKKKAVVATTAPAPTKKTAAKKSAPAPAAVKKGTKKAAVKTAPAPTKKKAAAKKSAPVDTAKVAKDGLRKPQIRVLQALLEAGKPLDRKQISQLGNVDYAMLNSYIGAYNDDVRAKNDRVVMPSLYTLGYIKFSKQDVDGRDVIFNVLTATGRKAIEKINKDA